MVVASVVDGLRLVVMAAAAASVVVVVLCMWMVVASDGWCLRRCSGELYGDEGAEAAIYGGSGLQAVGEWGRRASKGSEEKRKEGESDGVGVWRGPYD